MEDSSKCGFTAEGGKSKDGLDEEKPLIRGVGRLDIIAEWDDIRVCIVTCLAASLRRVIVKFLMVVVVIVAVGTSGYFALPYIVCMDIPEYEKLGAFNTNTLAFTMTCDHSPPYAFILGLGPSHTGPLVFRGEIVVQQRTETVARIQIDSEHSTPCNWLAKAGLDGYILTWGQTNATERLSKRLRRGQNYVVHVAFSEVPPTDSSLWFSSMGRARR
jgi:hypothetical protein